MRVLVLVCVLILADTIIGANQNIGQNAWLDAAVPPNTRTIRDRYFEPEHTYTFLYDAQLATGIPGASKQHSGTRIQCVAELIFTTPTSCVLQLSHVRIGRLNRKLANPRQIVPAEAFDEVPMHDDVKRTLEIPVGFTYVDGVVGDVTFDGEESPWSSNVVRGVLNTLQVTLNSERQLPTEDLRLVNLVKIKEELSKVHAKHYRVQEKTLEGDCESVYTMFNTSDSDSASASAEPADRVTIIKSVDFDKCRMRPEIKYNIRFAHPCPDCRAVGGKGKHEFLRPSTLARYAVRIGSGGSWLLEKANFESEHIFSPYDPRAGVAISYINQTLTLLKSDSSTGTARPINHPVKSDWGLVYALDWDMWQERFVMDGEEDRQLHFLRRMPYSDVKRRKLTLVRALVRALLSNMRTPTGSLDEEAPHYLMRIVLAFRIFTKFDIDEVYREMSTPGEGPWTNEERKLIKDVFPHFAAMCASKECIAFLVEKIQDGTIPPNKAASAIRNLLNDMSISEKKVVHLLELADSQVVAQNFNLRQSLWLTIGSLINGLCMDNEEILAREYTEDVATFCTRQHKENYVEILFNKFESSNSWTDRLLFMKAIGNAGLDLSIFNLEKVIRNLDGQHNLDSIRSQAILALRQLTNVMPGKILKILLPLVSNQLESPRVRISAAYQLLQTMPERSILDQLARMVLFDSSKQVASFILSYMSTLAESSSPCRKKMATDLKLALRHAREDHERRYGHSSMYYYNLYSEKYIAGLELESGMVFLNTSFLPKYLTTTIHANAMGFWQKYLLTFGLVQDRLEPFVRRWITGDGSVPVSGGSGPGNPQQQPGTGPESTQTQTQRLRRTVEAVVGEIQSELSNLFTKLGVVPRQGTEGGPSSGEEPKLYAYMKFMDQDYSLLPFILTQSQRDRGLADGAVDLSSLKEELMRGMNIDVTEAALLAEMSLKIPTVMGVPLVWRLKVPAMVSISGRIQAASTPDSGPWQTMKLDVDLKPSFVATIVMEMEAWSPVVNSGLKVVSKIKVNTPIRGSLEIDKRTDPAITKITLKSPPSKREILSLETRPVTLTRIWPYRELKKWNEPEVVTIMNEDESRISQFKGCFGKQIFGVDICVRGQYIRTRGLAKHAPQCPLSGVQKILVTEEPAGQVPAEISLKITTKFNEKSPSTPTPTFSAWAKFPDVDNSEQQKQQQEQLVNETSAVPDDNTRNRGGAVKFYKNSVKVEVESNKRPWFNADFVHYYEPNHLYDMMDWKMQTLTSPQIAVCLKSETQFPPQPYTIDDMRRNGEGLKALWANRITWGIPQCQEQNFASFLVSAHQPQPYNDMHHKDPEYLALEGCMQAQGHKANCSPVTQYEHLFKYSELTTYKMWIRQKNVPTVFTNASSKLYELLKHALYEYSDVNALDVRNPADQVYAELRIDPRIKRTVDLDIRTPNENAVFDAIPLKKKFPVINVKRGPMKRLFDYANGNGNRALCHVSNRKIRTFDGVEYSAPLSSCYHVLAADCSSASHPQFVVMMRKASNSDEKKEVKILTQSHKVYLIPKDGNTIDIDVNGRKYTANSEDVQEIKDERSVAIRIYSMGPYVKLEFPRSKMFVYFDGYAANIKLSRLYLGQQCGLCGHFDYENLEEFLNPDGTIEKNMRKFFMSWTLKGDPQGCTVPEYAPGRFFTMRGQTETGQSRLVQPLNKTKVVEINLEVCFSVEPVDECPLGSFPVKKESREVQYVCLQRDDELAEWALGKLRTDKVVRIDREPTGRRMTEIPIKCATVTEQAL